MDGCVDNQDYNDGAQDDHPIGQFNACYRCPFAKPFHDYPLPIFKQRLTKAKSRRVQGLFCLSFFTGDGQTRQCVGLTLIHLLVSAAIHPPTTRPILISQPTGFTAS